MRYQKSFYTLLSTLLLFLLWTSMAYFFREMPLICPSPLQVFKRIFYQYKLFGEHLLITLVEMVAGMLLATAISFCIAYMMFKVRLIKMILEPYFVIMQCVPMFVLAPIFIIWFGWSFIAIVIPTAMMIGFPLTMNIYKGLCSTPKDYIDFFRLHGASDWQLLFKVKLPFARPQIFAGLRISAAIAGMGAIGGEWAGAQKGLGVLIQICRRNFDLEGVFGCILCLLFLSLSFYSTILLIEKIVSKEVSLIGAPIKESQENLHAQKI